MASKTIVATLLAFSLAGCVTREDLRGLQADIHKLNEGLETRLGTVKDQADTVQTSQADLLLSMKDLSSNLSALQVQLEDNQARMNKLSLRLDDLQASLNARMDAQIELLSGSKFVETPLPSTVFNLANSDFSRGKYTEAVKGFQNYLKQFPKGEQANEARLKIGDSFSRLKQEAPAIEAYDELIEGSPKDPLVPSAILKKAQLYEAMGKTPNALKLYDSLIRSYPHRPEGKTAQERYNVLKNSQSR